jgi:hypothetical protein
VSAWGLHDHPAVLAGYQDGSQFLQPAHFIFNRIRFDIEMGSRIMVDALEDDTDIAGFRLERNEFAGGACVIWQWATQRGAPEPCYSQKIVHPAVDNDVSKSTFMHEYVSGSTTLLLRQYVVGGIRRADIFRLLKAEGRQIKPAEQMFA